MPKSRKVRRSRLMTARGASASMLMTWTRGPNQPPPVSNRQSYVRRRVVIELAAAGIVKSGDVATALGSGGDYAVEKISCWGTPTSLFSSTTFTAYPGVLLDGATVADPVVVTDSGSANSRPSVVYRIPPQKSVVFNRDTGGTLNFVEANTAATYHVDVLQYTS